MSEPALRNNLKEVELNIRLFPHPGLWLDKLLPRQFSQGEKGGEDAYRVHFETATTIPVADVYRHFYERWEKMLKTAGVKIAMATTQGRLVVGLGADSALENAITLHRTYGVPIIPGSALKGLAAFYARNRLDDLAWHVKKDEQGRLIYIGDAYRTLFGDTTSAGYVTFFDALYVPGSAEGEMPLALDVVTVHHSDYYQGKKTPQGEVAPPADWDSPNPVPFVSVRGGVKFLVALDGPEYWVEAAFQILRLALIEEGIGAKTNSGYGRMIVEQIAESTPGWEEFRRRVERVKPQQFHTVFVPFYEQWKALSAPQDVKRYLARALVEKIQEANLIKRWEKQARRNPEKAQRNFARYEELKSFAEGEE